MRTGSSSEKSTRRLRMPRRRHSLRMTRASGQLTVSSMRAKRSRHGSSLLAPPIAESSGTPRAWHQAARRSFWATVSMASIT